MTVKVSALSAAGSLVLGTVLAAMRVAPLPVLRTVGTLYVNVLRNTPLTLIILFCGLGLGSIVTRSSARSCGPGSIPSRSARPRPPARSG